MVMFYSEWYLSPCNIFQAGPSHQLISVKTLSYILLQTEFSCNLSTPAPVAMTNSFGLVNLLNIIAFCYFDKSIMSWFTYALGKIFIGAFYTKLSLVYINKASSVLMLTGAFQYLKKATLPWISNLTRSQEGDWTPFAYFLKIPEPNLPPGASYLSFYIPFYLVDRMKKVFSFSFNFLRVNIGTCA